MDEYLTKTIDITLFKTTDGPGDFGFGLDMDGDNKIIHIHPKGNLAKHPDGALVSVGMQVIQVNFMDVSPKRNVIETINTYITTNKFTLTIQKVIQNNDE